MQVRNPEHTLLQFKHTHRDATVITLQRKTMGQLLQLPFVLDGRLSSSRFLDLLLFHSLILKRHVQIEPVPPPHPLPSSLAFPAPLQFGTAHHFEWLIPEVQSGLFYQEPNVRCLGYHWAVMCELHGLYIVFVVPSLLFWWPANVSGSKLLFCKRALQSHCQHKSKHRTGCIGTFVQNLDKNCSLGNSNRKMCRPRNLPFVIASDHQQLCQKFLYGCFN